MATVYVTKRNTKSITRAELLSHPSTQGLVFLDASDEAKGLTIETANEIAVRAEHGAVWFEFGDNGQLLSLATYGSSSSVAAEEVAEMLGLEIVSEHDKDFSYHEFPVDVNTTEPKYKFNQWEGFLVDGTIYPYNRAQGMAGFYIAHQYEEQEDSLDIFVVQVAIIEKEYDL